MRGYEVIFKFPMISFKIPLESQFSRDPFSISLIPPPPPYGYPPCLVLMERYFQGLSWRGGFMARGPLSTHHGRIYPNKGSKKNYQYIYTLSNIHPILSTSPSPFSVPLQLHRDS